MSGIPHLGIPNITGHTLRVEAFHIAPSYAGLLEGFPNDEINTEEVAACRRQIESIHGRGRPIHVLPPAVSIHRGHPRLPPVTCWVWLTSNQPVRDARCDGSHLFLVWFTDLDTGQSLRELITAFTSHLPWTSVAKDFSF